MGQPPFYDANPQKMINNVLHENLTFPRMISDNSKDLVERLLEKSPALRLSSPDKIKSHPFFAEINWSSISSKSIDPPFIPKNSTRESEAANFDAEFTRRSLRLTPSQRNHTEYEHYKSFTYVDKQK